MLNLNPGGPFLNNQMRIWPKAVMAIFLPLLIPAAMAGEKELKPLPAFFSSPPMEAVRGVYDGSVVVSDPEFVIRMIQAQKPITPQKPMVGLITRTLSGSVVHLDHFSGLLRTRLPSLKQYTLARVKDEFQLFGKLRSTLIISMRRGSRSNSTVKQN